MRRRRSAATLLGALWLAACVGGEPTAPDAGPDSTFEAPAATLRLQPVLAPAVATDAAAAASIDRIRARVRDSATDELLATRVRDVDPEASSWELTVEVPMPDEGTLEVFVTVELLHTEAGTETVEWSGRTGVIRVGADRVQRTVLRQTPLRRGPVHNLEVESLEIVDAPAELLQGESAELTAEVEGGSDRTRVFWSSLDRPVASVSGRGVVRARRPGTARIVAEAGPVADTAEIEVLESEGPGGGDPGGGNDGDRGGGNDGEPGGGNDGNQGGGNDGDRGGGNDDDPDGGNDGNQGGGNDGDQGGGNDGDRGGGNDDDPGGGNDGDRGGGNDDDPGGGNDGDQGGGNDGDRGGGNDGNQGGGNDGDPGGGNDGDQGGGNDGDRGGGNDG